jgi:hypothetical protein
VPADLKQRVLSQLPTESPQTYRLVAEWVVRAWTDRELREGLRSDPIAFFTERGVPLTACEIRVVHPEEAVAPRGDMVWVPLPQSHLPVVSMQAAREALAATAFGWLLDDGEIRGLVDEPMVPEAVPVAETGLRGRPAAWLGTFRAPALRTLPPALVGAAAVLVLAIVAGIAGDSVTAGFAAGHWAPQVTGVIALVALAAIALGVLRGR